MDVQEMTDEVDRLRKLLDEYERQLARVEEEMIDIRVRIAELEGH